MSEHEQLDRVLDRMALARAAALGVEQRRAAAWGALPLLDREEILRGAGVALQLCAADTPWLSFTEETRRRVRCHLVLARMVARDLEL